MHTKGLFHRAGIEVGQRKLAARPACGSTKCIEIDSYTLVKVSCCLSTISMMDNPKLDKVHGLKKYLSTVQFEISLL